MGAEQLRTLEPGQLIVYGGDRVTRVPPELAAAFAAGDRLVVVQSTGDLLHVPRAEVERVDGATRAARRAFLELGTVDDDAISAFFGDFAGRLADDARVRADRRGQRRRRGRRPPPGALDHPPGAVRRGCAPTWSPACTAGGTRPAVAIRWWRCWSTRAGGSSSGGHRSAWSASSSRAAPTCSPTPAACCGAATRSCSASAPTRWHRPGDRRPRPGARPRRGRPAGRGGRAARQPGPLGRLGAVLAPRAGPRRRPRLGRGGRAAGCGGPPGRRAGEPARHRRRLARGGRLGRSRPLRRRRRRLPRPQGLQHAQRVLHPRGGGAGAGAALPRRAWSGPPPAATRLAKLHVLEGGERYVPAERFERKVALQRAEGVVTEVQAETLPEGELGREWEWEGSPEVTLAVVASVSEAVELFNRHSPRLVATLVVGGSGGAGALLVAGRRTLRRRRVHPLGRRPVRARPARARAVQLAARPPARPQRGAVRRLGVHRAHPRPPARPRPAPLTAGARGAGRGRPGDITCRRRRPGPRRSSSTCRTGR